MMFRDWREITKVLLSAKGPLQDVRIPKSRMRRPETQLYRKWVEGEIRRDKDQFDGFNKGKGIIATRERFLQWMQTEKGQQVRAAGQEEAPAKVEDKKFGKTIIVPVAIPGCGEYHGHRLLSLFSVLTNILGKTAISVALQKLFGFGHTQSDDVRVKKSAPVFIQNVMKELKTHDVVIADK